MLLLEYKFGYLLTEDVRIKRKTIYEHLRFHAGRQRSDSASVVMQNINAATCGGEHVSLKLKTLDNKSS